jgi:hypothetical protein
MLSFRIVYEIDQTSHSDVTESRHERHVCPSAVFPKLFACEPVLASDITTDPHIPALVSIECLDDKHPKFKICISELILDRYQYIPLAYVTMHCMIRP